MRIETLCLPAFPFLSLTLAAATPAAPLPHVLEVLQSTLSGRVAADQFSGVMLVARHGQVVFQEAEGYADHAFGVRNRIDTKFNLASMGKMFTGVAVLQLVQAGKASLDQTLAEVWPDYPNREVARRITLRQLLTHTSGLPDFFGPEFHSRNPADFDTLESLLPLFAAKPLRFAPGSRWAYSNAGYIVLGMVVQKLSGQSYYDYVRRHIFEPAGMRDTDNWPADADVPNRATGYTALDDPTGKVRKSNIFFLQRGGSAGGGYSTAADLLRFTQALQGGVLLNAAYTALAMSGQVATVRPHVRYGFGFEETILNGVRIVGHSGGDRESRTSSTCIPTSGTR